MPLRLPHSIALPVALILLIAGIPAAPSARAQGRPAGEEGVGRSRLPVGESRSARLTGEVRDLQTGQILIGAVVSAPAVGVGTTTDTSGRYRLELARGAAVQVHFEYLGFAAVTRTFELNRETRFDVYLPPAASTELAEVVVRGRRLAADAGALSSPVDGIDVRDVRLLPSLLGEADVLQAIKLRPGVASGSESNHGLYVRGGSADQNLVLFGGARLYNPNHLFGFFSTFNPDAVSGVRLYKGGFPARYGGRLASVIDVGAREGDAEALTLRGGLGLLSSRLGVEGPIAGARSSFSVSGRRTYVDLLTGPINGATDDEAARGEPLPGYNFHDLNARADFDLGPRDHLALTGYLGRDRLRFESFFFDLGLGWGNTAGSAVWRHAASPATTLETTASVSRYDYSADNRTAGYDFELASGITDVRIETHGEHLLGARHRLGFGGSAAALRYEIADVGVVDATGEVSYSGGRRDLAGEYAAYLEDAVELTPRLRAVAGLRVGAFVNGAAVFLRPEPRLLLRHEPSPQTGLHVSYSRMVQYAHLVAPAGLALPIDFWHPSTEQTLPQISDQVSLGASHRAAQSISLSVQGFYKGLRNQVEFVDGANPFASTDVERAFSYGRGRAYGTEAKIERHEGRLRGWVGYTLQRVVREGFAEIMGGRGFSPRFDRRHDLSAVLTYRLSTRLRATASWVYGSGDLAWLPRGRQAVADAPGADFKAVVPVYGDRNNFRLAPYHRGDVSLTWDLAPSWGESDLTFAIYNVYDRRNAFFVYLRPVTRPGEVGGASVRVPQYIRPRQQSLFPILPSVTWNFTFAPARAKVGDPDA